MDYRSLIRLMALGLAAVIFWRGASWAAGSSDPASNADLQSEVTELKHEIQDLKTQINTIKTQNEIKTPATPVAGATPIAPATVGEHVGSIEKDLSDIKSNLATNLGVHIHGLVEGSYEYNLNHPNTSGGSKGGLNCCSSGGSTNQLRVFDTEGSGFDLTQFLLHVDKTSDTGLGFVTDLNFGQVANVLRASTRNSNLNPAATSNDVIDLTQAFLTYTAPVGSGINLQLGRFVTLLGAEVIPTYNTYGSADYNISRDFIFGFGIPFTHTGLRGTYNVNDKVGITLGVNNGWDDITNNNDGQTVEGELSLNTGTLMGSNQSLALLLNGIYGPEQVNHGNSTRWVIDPVLTYKTPISGLQLIAEYMYANEGGPVSVVPAFSSHGNRFCATPTAITPFCTPAPGFTAGPNGTVNILNGVSWTGAAGYIVYDLNENVELATRGEWFRDSDGARTGLRQTLGEITETLNYKVPNAPGLLARLEYRHDESSAKPFFNSDTFASNATNTASLLAGLPNHTRSGQDTFMASAVYSF